MKKTERFSCIFFGIVFFYFNFIPIIGSIIGGYLIGKNQSTLEKEFMISKSSLLKTIYLSHIVIFLLFALILNFIVEFTNNNHFWLIIFTGLIINMTLAIIFFYIGMKKK